MRMSIVPYLVNVLKNKIQNQKNIKYLLAVNTYYVQLVSDKFELQLTNPVCKHELTPTKNVIVCDSNCSNNISGPKLYCVSVSVSYIVIFIGRKYNCS